MWFNKAVLLSVAKAMHAVFLFWCVEHLVVQIWFLLTVVTSLDAMICNFYYFESYYVVAK